MLIAAIIHDLERHFYITSYEVCEFFGPNVLKIITNFSIFIWYEKVFFLDKHNYDKKIGDLKKDKMFLETIEYAGVLRLIDWIDNVTEKKYGYDIKRKQEAWNSFFVHIAIFLKYDDIVIMMNDWFLNSSNKWV